jgi:hypothetical protein
MCTEKRTNKELRELNKATDLEADSKRRRFEWFDPIVKLEQERANKFF